MPQHVRPPLKAGLMQNVTAENTEPLAAIAVKAHLP
jgi:hypothetical protein